MNVEKIIDFVEDVETLRKICKAMEKEAWNFELKYNSVKREIEEIKEENEKLQKFFNDLGKEKETVQKIDNITIQMGGR